MIFFTDSTFAIFIVVFVGNSFNTRFPHLSWMTSSSARGIGFFILGGCVLKYVHERRLRARLQQELNGLLFEYAPLEGNEIETIAFINAQSQLTGPRKV